VTPYYEHGGITIYHGDCRDGDWWLTSDVLVTDPPYGISYRSGHAGDVWEGGSYVAVDGSIAGDGDTSLRDLALTWWGDKPAIVFGSYRASFPRGWKQILVWDKGESAGMGDLEIPWKPNTEPIFVLGRWANRVTARESSVLRATNISRLSMGRCHPHMKPVCLLQRLISKMPDGVVVDPFMGSGPTLEAAKNLGRRAIGIEIEERYCEIAAKRLEQEVLPLEVSA
jgi:hypothetical protein